ncbi:MAG: hypothetical protein KTR25_04725 [Myxococcales bacterium]|nr:hypothetical protein [Myxococcales bacterium]
MPAGLDQPAARLRPLPLLARYDQRRPIEYRCDPPNGNYGMKHHFREYSRNH